MIGRIKLKKIAPFLVVVGIFTAMVSPLALHSINELTPYLNLTSVLEMPEEMEAVYLEIVDREYDKTAEESLLSISNTEINTAHPIYEVDGIFLQSEYGLDHPKNYYNSRVFIHDNSIDLSNSPLPNHIYSNIHTRSTFIDHRDVFTINQSADDAWTWAKNLPFTNYAGSTLDLGNRDNPDHPANQQIVFRWNISIPENAEISNAYLNLTVSSISSKYDGFKCRIVAFDDISTPDFSNTFEQIRLNRERTSESVVWQMPLSPTPNETYQSSNFASVLQYIINRDDWKNNSIFGLCVETRGEGGTSEEICDINEYLYFHSFDGPNPQYKPKLIIEWGNYSYTYNESEIDVIDQCIRTEYDIVNVIGVWNTSDHSYGNLYNESNGDFFFGKTIILKTPQPRNETSLWYSYEVFEVPIVVEYTIKEWTSITWHYSLKLDNRGDNDIIFPAANATLNYLDKTLGKGWFSRTNVVRAHRSEIVDLYVTMENNKLSASFMEAMFLGLDFELKGIMEIYILLEDANGEPLLPLIMVQEFDFVLPTTVRGPPPFIHSLTRGGVSAYEDVEINVIASDLDGTGINDKRSYIYYSIDNGISWKRVQLIGPPWTNYWREGQAKPYPIPSFLSPQTYSAEIPGFPGGIHVFFYVYLEDYAASKHNKPGNIAYSQTYSYVVPSGGKLSSFSVEFEYNPEDNMSEKFLDWMERHGINPNHYLYTQDIWFKTNTLYDLVERFSGIAEFLEFKDIDTEYLLNILVSDFGYATNIMEDSGVPAMNLLLGFGLNLPDIENYIIDTVMLPANDEFNYLAQQRLNEIFIVDDLEGSFAGDWISTPSGNVGEETVKRLNINDEFIGTKSLKWNTSEPSILIRNKSLNYVIDFEDKDILTFYLAYDNYTRLNGRISVNFVDNLGRKMRSNPIQIENRTNGSFQEIAIPINYQNFREDSGFNFEAVNKIEFEYSGIEQVKIYIDYISIYSQAAYSSHQYFTYELQIAIKDINGFNGNHYFGMDARDPIEIDWSANLKRTSYWNFLDLIATSGLMRNKYGDEIYNQHTTVATLFLEWYGVQKPYETLLSLIGAKIEELPPTIKDKDIYPYTQKFTMTAIYFSLGFIASLASIKRIGRYRTRKKIEKIRKKYEKKIIK